MKHIRPLICIVLVTLACTSVYAGPPFARDVNVVNTPLPVDIINPSLDISGTVRVTNPSSDPVLVRDINNPALEPFHTTILADADDGSAVGREHLSIPTGKLLVVENVSAVVSLPIGQKVIRLGVKTEIPHMGLVEHFIPSQFQGTQTADRDIFIAGQPMRLYADPQLNVAFERDSFDGHASAQFAISGYLVDSN